MTKYLDTMDIPCISEESKLLYDLPLSITEKAIKCMANNKTPGPDGIPVEFYKLVVAKLVAWFMKAFKMHMNFGNFQIAKDREL